MKKYLYLLLAILSLVLVASKVWGMIKAYGNGLVPGDGDFVVALIALLVAGIFILAYYVSDYRQKKAEIEELKRRAKRR